MDLGETERRSEGDEDERGREERQGTAVVFLRSKHRRVGMGVHMHCGYHSHLRSVLYLSLANTFVTVAVQKFPAQNTCRRQLTLTVVLKVFKLDGTDPLMCLERVIYHCRRLL